MPPRSTLALGAVLAAVFLTAPLYAHREKWGIFDWDQKLMEEGHARRALVAHGELALWNPYVGGGKSAVGDPLSRHLSPFFLPVVALGELLGCRVVITLHLAIGMVLAMALARDFGVPSLPAVVAALVGFGNGSMAWHLSYGHLEWCSAAFVPGCLLFARRAARGGRGLPGNVLLGGLCLALLLLEGGIYLVPPTIGALGAMAVVTSVMERRGAPLGGFLAVAAAGLLLGAVKLLPMAEMAHRHPRSLDGTRRAIGFHVMAGASPTLPAQVWELFLRRTAMEDSIVYRTDASCFVGIGAALLTAVGAVGALSRMLPLMVPAAAILWIHLGPFLPWDPWPLLGRVGPLRSLRFPERFVEVAAVLCGVVAAQGLALACRGRRRWEAAGAGLLLLGLASHGWPLYHRAFTRDPVPVAPKPFAQVGFPVHSTYHTFLEGQGADRGYDVTPRHFHVKHAGEAGYRGEAFILSGRGEARVARLTASRIEVDVDAPGGSLLVVNQNYDPGFSVTGGASPFLQSRDGLLAVAVREGRSRVTFAYRPPAFFLGAAISLTALAGLAALAWREEIAAG